MAFTNIYCVGSTLSRRMRWVGNVAPTGEVGRECSTYRGERGAYRVLVGKSEGKRPCGRPRHRR